MTVLVDAPATSQPETPTTPTVPVPLLPDLTAALDTLIVTVESGALDALADDDLLAFTQQFERLRNLHARVDHRIVVACDRSELAVRHLRRTTQGLLTEVLRISPVEARRRVQAAHALAPRPSPTGETRPARYARLAAVAASGTASTETVSIAVGCLDRLEARFSANSAELGWAEDQLCAPAAAFAPTDFRQIAATLTDILFPDGLLDDETIQDSRELTLTRSADGSYRLQGRLTGVCGSLWAAALSPLSAPRAEDPGGQDRRSAAQRQHDAFHEAGLRLLRAGGLPDSGGTPCTMIVLIHLEDLLQRTGHGQTSDGQRVPVAELLKLASEAELIPVVLTRTGIPLTLGRAARSATKHQTLALIARDGGCSFPGCDHPPEWCDRHHIQAWRDNGRTDIDNLTLLCHYHHNNFEHRGWTCRLRHGLPAWIPPRWIDPHQQPLVNTRIIARHQALLAADAPP
ncbi:hypothetical protein GCM10009841_36190 [Microlunatus panaciterrae]|uniref:HNH nuclease domain-containing protein n=1 Tax=Microlunatus panaciterrae TaxID=400768 RepID=A0ABS2RGZ3_9ACTN|nr:HNH endonuclease signature motif containing protein [Microlunatus panaciterrae]MBM7798279.1 hypothetical protein [Microlunatus panaciterrae]